MSALDPHRYIYTPDDELALRRLHQRNAHFVLCCCVEYVESRQDRLLTKRWEKARQRAGTDQKAAKQPFFGGSNGKGRQWEQHPASADALTVQLGERRGLVGIVPSTVGAIVFDADSDLASDAERLAELFGHAPLAVVASSQPKRGHVWYRLPPGLHENNRVYFLEGEGRGEIRASNGYILLWRPAELLAQLPDNLADAPTLTSEQIKQTRKPKNKPAYMGNAPPTAASQHTDEIGRRPCDADWTAESLAAQSEGGRHDALKSYLAHYRATTPDERWPDVLDYLRPAFLAAKPGGEYEFEQLAAYYAAKPPAEPLRKRYPSAHSNSYNTASPSTLTNSDAPEWQHGDPDAPPPLETLKKRALEALDKGDTDALDRVLADARTLCDATSQDKPTRETVHKAFAAVEVQYPDSLRPAISQLATLIQWERRPKARTVYEINDPQPVPLLTAAGQDGPLLVPGTVATLSGAGDIGKSRLALQTALQFAAANEQGPTPYRRLWEATAGSALVCTYEDAPAITRERLRQQADRLECTGALGRVHVLDLTGWPLFGPGEAQSYNSRPSRLPGFDVLAEEAEEIAPRLIVIDPALSAFVGESNAVAPVREFVAALAQLASRHNAAVLLVAHSTKAARSKQNGETDPFDAGQVSGSAAWHDAARAGLVLTRDGDGWTLAISKSNYGPAFLKAELEPDGAAFSATDSPVWRGKGDKLAGFKHQGGDDDKGGNPYG